jgi:hypothetical protein
VVINEFLTLPHSDWNHDGVVDNGDAFVEIKNLSTIPVTVTNWYLDDQEGDSSPYYLPDLTLEPGARAVYFSSQTKIAFSNSGDSVRLFKPGFLSDAFTYGVIDVQDRSWCRLPDGGQDAWLFGCEPTPGETNQLPPTVVVNGVSQPSLCTSSSTLLVVYQAECTPSGLEIWSRRYWPSGYSIYIQREKQLDAIE